MSKCWYKLNLNTENAISKDWQFPQFDVRKFSEFNNVGVWSFKSDKIFQDDWLKYMDEMALPINRSIVFYRDSNLVDTEAHIDLVSEVGGPAQSTHFGFNLVFGGAGSEMIWYDMPPGDLNLKVVPGNNKILTWPVKDLVEIDRCSILPNEPTIVRTDIPHSLSVGNEPRWCISARTSMHHLTWDDAIENLIVKNIIIDR